MKRLKITFNSPVVLWFAFSSLLVLLLGVATGFKSTQFLFMTYHSPLNDPMTYVRFFTHVLGHADGAHFISNMAYFLLLGPVLEEKYGSVRVLQVIGVTAVVTGVINYVLFPGVALCGASGVCFAFIILTSFTGFRDREIPLTLILVAAIFIGQQVYEAVMVQNDISNMAHIVGGIIGGVFGFLLKRRRRR